MIELNLKFKNNWLKKGDVITYYNDKPLVVIDTPKRKYYKWYWRIINILTFKAWFNPGVYYTVGNIAE